LVIAEGKSECIFIRRILARYFLHHSGSRIILHAVQNETSYGYFGGIVNYPKLVQNITRQLNYHPFSYVTTFIDFYGLATIEFPFYRQVLEHTSTPYEQTTRLEGILAHAIGNIERFIPYLQLHEFEALYFADYERFLKIDPKWTSKQKHRILEIVDRYPNPELINNSFETAPSKRLRHILHYHKVHHTDLYQNAVRLQAYQVVDHMRYKCPHFNEWIKKILELSGHGAG
jgi:hypothetical protein